MGLSVCNLLCLRCVTASRLISSVPVLVFILSLLGVSQALAAPVLDLASTGNSISLGNYLDIYEDVDGASNFDDLINANHSDGWLPCDCEAYNKGMRNSVVWFRFNLSNSRKDLEKKDFVLFTDRVHELSYFFRSENGQWVRQVLHAEQMGLAAEIENAVVFPVENVKASHQTVYFKAEFRGPTAFPLFIMNERGKLSFQKKLRYSLGGYYGVMFAMALYNLFLYFSVRSKSYAAYVAYILSLAIYMLHADGITTELIWSGDAILNGKFLAFFAACTIVFTCNFSRSFLNLEERLPVIDYVVRGIMLLGVLLAAASFFTPIAQLMQGISMLVLVMTILMVTVGVYLHISGYKDTRFFLIAWSGFLVGSFFCTAMWMGLLPWSFTLQYAMHWGSFFETILLSLALADRINTYRQEKEQVENIAKLKLEKKNTELMLNNRLKDEFLATVSHELRTPMNGVVGALELLDSSLLDYSQQSNVAAGTRSARDMMRLIDDLLGFSELQSGDIRVEQEVFELKAALLQLHTKFLGQSALKGIQFEFQVHHSLPTHWRADKGRFMLIIYHLLENAIKFTEKGSVFFSIKPSAKTDQINQPDQQWVDIEIKDTGIGISEDKLNQIFSAFLQVDGSYARKYGGLGIGLAICKKTVNLMGGEITVTSKRGRGSKFKVTLPLQVADHVSTHITATKEQSEINLAGHIHALVVEDNQVNQKVLMGILKKLGCEVTAADNGREAVNLIRDESFDVIFMDCQMPVMDGFEATQRIRQSNTGNSTVPIIAVTANVLSSDKEKCLSIGMDHFVKKPVKLSQIKEILFLSLNEKAA